MFNITSKHFNIFNNKPPVGWLLIKSTLIHEYQHKSKRVNRSQQNSTQINTSLATVNANEHESNTSQARLNTSQRRSKTDLE